MPLHSALAKLFGYTQTLAFCNTVTPLSSIYSVIVLSWQHLSASLRSVLAITEYFMLI
jgi:hypothetical protein